MIVRPRTINDSMFCCECGALAHQIININKYAAGYVHELPLCNACLVILQGELNQIPIEVLER